MVKHNKPVKSLTPPAPQAQPTAPATPVAAAAPAPQPVQYYTVVAPKRALHEGTKHGINGSGTAGTHAALANAARANGGQLTAQQAREICVARGDKGFFGYAVNRLKVLVPVAAPAVAPQVQQPANAA